MTDHLHHKMGIRSHLIQNKYLCTERCKSSICRSSICRSLMIMVVVLMSLNWISIHHTWAQSTKTHSLKSQKVVDSKDQKKQISQKKNPSILAKFRCMLGLEELRVRARSQLVTNTEKNTVVRSDQQINSNKPITDQDSHQDSQLIVKLFGPKKEYLFSWVVETVNDEAQFRRSFSWVPCSRYQAFMLIVYRRLSTDELELIGELPLRADLISRMPERHETKQVILQLSGGDVRLLKLNFEITAEELIHKRRVK